MSKSYGNYIGITEAPTEMFGKVMSISDELMWRYYELLTDVTTSEIDELKQAVAKGQAHPMKLKQELGIRIVKDFHGHDAADHAAADWSRMFQKDEAPEELPLVTVKFSDVAAPGAPPLSRSDRVGSDNPTVQPGAPPLSSAVADDRVGTENPIVQVQLAKLLFRTGLATSVSDGLRKLKQNAVKIDGELKNDLVASVELGSEFTLRAGKKMVKVRVEG
jgi:tyrosyl-tRNA synthetase